MEHKIKSSAHGSMVLRQIFFLPFRIKVNPYCAVVAIDSNECNFIILWLGGTHSRFIEQTGHVRNMGWPWISRKPPVFQHIHWATTHAYRCHHIIPMRTRFFLSTLSSRWRSRSTRDTKPFIKTVFSIAQPKAQFQSHVAWLMCASLKSLKQAGTSQVQAALIKLGKNSALLKRKHARNPRFISAYGNFPC